MSPEEKEAQFDAWLEKYAPDGPWIKEMTAFEKDLVETYPTYDLWMQRWSEDPHFLF